MPFMSWLEGSTPMSKAVLMDLWRTIIEPVCTLEEYYRTRARALLEATGLSLPQSEVDRAYEVYVRERDLIDERRKAELLEIPASEVISIFLRSMGIAPRVEREHLLAYSKPFLELTRLTEGARGAIEGLSRDYTLALVSNIAYGYMAREVLSRNSILGFFSAFVTSDEVRYRKPHPNVFFRALELIGAKPSDAVMVGDDIVDDVQGAMSVGMKAIWIRRPQIEPGFESEAEGTRSQEDLGGGDSEEADATVDSMLEVPAAVKEVLG